MKILIVAQNLQMGGIQKSLINTLKEINSYEEYEIDIFSFGKGVLIDEIPPEINIYTGNLILELISTPFKEVLEGRKTHHIVLRAMCMLIVRLVGSDKFYLAIFHMQKNFSNYDIAISYFNDVESGYFNKGTNLFVDKFVEAKKKIAWIHTDPIEAGFDYMKSINRYNKFDSLVCVSGAVRQKFAEFLPEYANKMNVVYNMFPIEEIRRKSLEYIPFKKSIIDIVSVGRIDNLTKRFDLIPYICRMLKDSNISNFKWRIVGDGPDLIRNKKIVDKLDVNDIVEFVGEYRNPYPFIKQSDILILTSAYEGYPMVIGEALTLLVPVITTNFAAAQEQIRDGFNGIITNYDLEHIFDTLKKILENPNSINDMKKYINENQFSNRLALEQLKSELDNIENYR